MSQVEELKPVEVAKGSTLRMFLDHSKPEDSLEFNWTEVTYDGKEDSELLQVPMHWHDYHDEIMEVLEGRMIFYHEGKELVTSAGDPPLIIPRGERHGFTAIKGERVRFTERTAPGGTFKAFFFQDMFQFGSPGVLHAMRVMYDNDTWPALPGGFKLPSYLMAGLLGNIIARPFVAPKIKELRRLEK